MKSKTATLLILMTIVTSFSLEAAQDLEEEAFQMGTEAYIYGYPLVLMDVTKKVMTNVPFPQKARAPINQFAHTWEFVTPDYKDLSCPDLDTLWSMAWLNLEKEPIVLHVPEIRDRFYQLSLYDPWSHEFASLDKGGDYVLVGPDWKETLPKGAAALKMPYNRIWIMSRIQCAGTAKEFAIVNHLQQQFALVPGTNPHKYYKPPTSVPTDPKVDVRTPPIEQVEAMNATLFFNNMMQLLKAFPGDDSMLKKLTQLGLQESEWDKAIVKGLERAVSAAQTKIKATESWTQLKETKNDYLNRAQVCRKGLQNKSLQNRVCFYTSVDSDGKALSGGHHYRMRFAKDQLPPVKGFWSVTLYNEREQLIRNPFNRYAFHSINKLKYNDDGSLDLYLQHVEPVKKRAHWLTIIKGNFNILFRLYRPTEALGSWKPPLVEKFE